MKKDYFVLGFVCGMAYVLLVLALFKYFGLLTVTQNY